MATLLEKIEGLASFDLVRIWLSASSSELQIAAKADGEYIRREDVLRIVGELDRQPNSFYVAPAAPVPEPCLELRYGESVATITYSGLHHWLNCGGWGDRKTTSGYFWEDRRFEEWLMGVQRTMGDAAAKALKDLRR